MKKSYMTTCSHASDGVVMKRKKKDPRTGPFFGVETVRRVS